MYMYFADFYCAVPGNPTMESHWKFQGAGGGGRSWGFYGGLKTLGHFRKYFTMTKSFKRRNCSISCCPLPWR